MTARRLLLVFAVALTASCTKTTDVLIVGGGAAGVSAGIQAARMGADVTVVEETPWLGGMLTSAGVSAFDGNYRMRGGIFGEFVDSLAMRYSSGDIQKGLEAMRTGWVSNVNFEPHVGQQILTNMAHGAGRIRIIRMASVTETAKDGDGWRVKIAPVWSDNLSDKPGSSSKSSGKSENGRWSDEKLGIIRKLRAKVLIDATELGDVAAGLGLEYDLGMEARSVTGESIAPEKANDVVQDLTLVAVLKDYGPDADMTIERPAGYDSTLYANSALGPWNHNVVYHDADGNEVGDWTKAVDGKVLGSKRSVYPGWYMLDYGKLPVLAAVQAEKRAAEEVAKSAKNRASGKAANRAAESAEQGSGKASKKVVSGKAANRAVEEVAEPAEQGSGKAATGNGFIGAKYMLNWPLDGNDFYTNLIERDEAARKAAIDSARAVTLGFIYFIQHQLGFKNIGIADDEFPTKDGLALIPYHRESRRFHGEVRFIMEDAADPYRNELYRTGVAVGDYPVDHHHYRYPHWESLPYLAFYPIPSFTVPMGTMLPKGCNNLIITEKSISSSNLINGTTRLQPVVMELGQAAGALAALAVQKAEAVGDVQSVGGQGDSGSMKDNGKCSGEDGENAYGNAAGNGSTNEGSKCSGEAGGNGSGKADSMRASHKVGTVSTADVAVREMQQALLDAGCWLMPYVDVPANDPDFVAIQRIGACGILRGLGQSIGWNNQTLFRPDDPLEPGEIFLNGWLKNGDPNIEKLAKALNINIISTAESNIQECGRCSDGATSKDVQEGSEYADAGQKCSKEETVAGSRKITRREAAVLIDSLLHPFQIPVDIHGRIAVNFD